MKSQSITASPANTRTNIVLDDDLIAKAMVRAKVTTKKAAVEAALRAYVRTPDYSGLLALRGTGVIADDYDPDEAYQRHPVESVMPVMPHYVSEQKAQYVVTPASKSSARKLAAK